MKQYFSIELYQPGEVIFTEGSPAATLYIIFSGAVNITKLVDGKNVLVASLGMNDMFGDMALIDHKPRSATATATEATECYVMEIDDLRARIDEIDPLLRRVFLMIVDRLRDTTELLAKHTQLPIV